MSIQDHIACLEQLSALDQEIRVIEDQLSEGREALSGRKAELSRLEERIATDAQSIADMSRTRGELVLEVRQVAAQVERSREKLSRSRNERETNAATRELEELRRIQKDREEEIGKLQLLEAEAQKSKDEAEVARAQLVEELGNTEEKTSKSLSDVEISRSEKLAARKELVKQLPRPLVSRYDMIRQRRGIAIAVTQDGTCQACHMAVPPQLFQKILRNEGLEQCPSCQRILYYRPPEAPQSSG